MAVDASDLERMSELQPYSSSTGKTPPPAFVDAMWELSSHDLPDFCVSLGLAEGTTNEASLSKKQYVKKRTLFQNTADIVSTAEKANARLESFRLREEILKARKGWKAEISEITRQAVLTAVEGLDSLGGELTPTECLERAWPLDNLPSSDSRFRTLREDLDQHTVLNPQDYTAKDVLRLVGIEICSDEQVLRTLEAILHPLCLKEEKQAQLADQLNSILARDGFCFELQDFLSGYPVYGWSRTANGVAGKPKNLIFASNGPKPEITLSDSINNDVEIVKNAESVLVFQQPIGINGLTWILLLGGRKPARLRPMESLRKRRFTGDCSAR